MTGVLCSRPTASATRQVAADEVIDANVSIDGHESGDDEDVAEGGVAVVEALVVDQRPVVDQVRDDLVGALTFSPCDGWVVRDLEDLDVDAIDNVQGAIGKLGDVAMSDAGHVFGASRKWATAVVVVLRIGDFVDARGDRGLP